MSVPVTVVIPTLNEAGQIAACVESVGWADRVIVADNSSSDGTTEIAQASGADVIRCSGNSIAGQRNAAIEAADTAWVFAIDADERASSELGEEISKVVAEPRHEVYAVRRRNFFLGREIKHGGWGSDWVVRLFPRSKRYEERRVHEQLGPARSEGRLQATLGHEPYRDLGEFRYKQMLYARWAASDLRDRGDVAGWTQLLSRPPSRLFRMYVLQKGFLDGWRGFLLALLAAQGVFLKYRLSMTR